MARLFHSFTLFQVDYLDSTGMRQQYRCGARDFERGLQMITELRRTGAFLVNVTCCFGKSWHTLPTAAFDQEDMTQPIIQLQQQWTKLLAAQRK